MSDALLDDPQVCADLIGTELTAADVARKYNRGQTWAKKWRRRLREDPTARPAEDNQPQSEASSDFIGKMDLGIDGGEFTDVKTDKPLTDWSGIFKRFNLDPREFRIKDDTVRMSTWQQSKRLENGDRDVQNLYSYRASFVRIVNGDVDWDEQARFIEDFTYIPAKRDYLISSCIIQPTDEQYGKTDFDGGTLETTERVLNSYGGFAEFVREFRPRQILLARTGDGIENFCSTGSQRDTNDLDLPHMMVQSFKMDLAGLKMIAPLAQEVINAYVPSNHGRWRTGPKADAGDPHADFGIAVGKQLAETLEVTGAFPNVRTVFPEHLMESLTVRLDGLNVGLVHGHQAGNPDKIGDWWARQDHGRMPTWNADVLLVGHFHSTRMQQSGDKRWIFVGPASDNGSSWFSNLKGERASSGMLALAFEGRDRIAMEII